MQIPSLRTARLQLRVAGPGDAGAMASFYAENQEFLQPFSPTFERDIGLVASWEERLAAATEEFERGRSVRMALFSLAGEVIGIANFTGIARFPSYSCTLGYSLGERHQGQGFMEEALREAVRYMFSSRQMHRVSANYMPRNERSGRLLRRLGFHVEGYARDYLLIDGKWEDHVLASLTNEQWRL